ncbi:MAG: hypothetical protein EDM05_000495 [Leptolyngbya sp. IPPAS B-1204]
MHVLEASTLQKLGLIFVLTFQLAAILPILVRLCSSEPCSRAEDDVNLPGAVLLPFSQEILFPAYKAACLLAPRFRRSVVYQSAGESLANCAVSLNDAPPKATFPGHQKDQKMARTGASRHYRAKTQKAWSKIHFDISVRSWAVQLYQIGYPYVKNGMVEDSDFISRNAGITQSIISALRSAPASPCRVAAYRALRFALRNVAINWQALNARIQWCTASNL